MPRFAGAKLPRRPRITVALEEIASMASKTIAVNPKASALPKHLYDKHFLRRNGETA
jgi:hypothetical protein